MLGTVYSGINNIYSVRGDDGGYRECHIKGKVLVDTGENFNPLAPGDRVKMEPIAAEKGMILSRLPRANRFARWNRKRNSWQVIAANLDILAVVASTRVPPFRPRFVDRAVITALLGEVRPMVILNKIDQGVGEDLESRLAAWETIGIPVRRISALTGEGLEDLSADLTGKTCALFGASGVGKSTLLNVLVPGHDLSTAEISSKHERGKHATNFARMLDAVGGGHLVDSPGVREIPIRGIKAAELFAWFPELPPLSGRCAFQPCSHRHEPECAVREAVERGEIHPDRYKSYLLMHDELEAADSQTR